MNSAFSQTQLLPTAAKLAADGTPANPTQRGKAIRVLVYISHKRITTRKPRDKYTIRINHAIPNALSSGVPLSFMKNVLRKWVPNSIIKQAQQVIKE